MIVFHVLKKYMGERFHYHEVRRSSELYKLLNAFIGAYNRRTDVLAAERADQQKINELTQQLKAANDSLAASLNLKETK